MVFSSLIFLYAFMPLCMAAYMMVRTVKAKNIVLLIFSLIFYAWGEPKYVLLLLLMSFADWYAALRIEAETDKKKRRSWVAAACVFDLILLGIFKYGKMFASVFGEPPAFIANIALPIGISFYTFQLISYVVDVYRREVKAQKQYWHVLLYAALFHQCVAGPIVRYQTVERELYDHRDPFQGNEIPEGIKRFCIGLAKKAIVANACGKIVDSLILSDSTIADPSLAASNLQTLGNASVVALWAGLAISLLQIYFDFSAYSDMAIGMGKMLGIHYPENFNYPYLARSVAEYWRRWHMSLGQWFRDYLYYPLALGPAIKVRKFFSKFCSRKVTMHIQSAFTMAVLWFCTGLWHGASWNFALWGLYYFVFLFMEQTVLKKVLDKLPAMLGRVYVWLVLIFGRVIFRYNSLDNIWTVFKGMFGANGNRFSDFPTVTILKNNYVLLIFCVVAATPLFKIITDKVLEKTENNRVLHCAASIVLYGLIPAALLLLSTAALVGNSYNPFMYFRF